MDRGVAERHRCGSGRYRFAQIRLVRYNASRGLREEVTNLVTTLGRTTAGSVEQLGQAARLAGRLKGNGRVRQ